MSMYGSARPCSKWDLLVRPDAEQQRLEEHQPAARRAALVLRPRSTVEVPSPGADRRAHPSRTGSLFS